MKKVVLAGLACLAVMAIAGVVAFRTIAAKESSAVLSQDVGPKSAKALQGKVDAVRNAGRDPHHVPGSRQVELSEAELESYLLYALKDDIPAKIDSAQIQLGTDTISLDTQITFVSNATGNAVVDTLVGGTHNLFLKGKLVGQQNRGKFDLQQVRVDSIPVPNILIQTLLKKYVKPTYPEADINEPFDLPWDIQSLRLEPGKATVIY